MPIYAYKCSHCDRVSEDHRLMADRAREDRCPECSLGMMRRNIHAELSNSRGEWEKPIFSDAAGVAPEQIPEIRRRFPHHEFTPDGRMVFRSLGHQRRCLQDIGMIDKDAFR